MSQCWALDAAAAEGYEARYVEFMEMHRAQPGFRRRLSLRGVDDPLHLINVRFFDDAEAYHEMVATPGYGEHIDALSQFLDLGRMLPKEYLDVVIDGD